MTALEQAIRDAVGKGGYRPNPWTEELLDPAFWAGAREGAGVDRGMEPRNLERGYNGME
jgi:hypothetical protein